MKTVCYLNNCTGCTACVNACPKEAISILDERKYLNAIIDEKKCINCGICEKVCPQLSPIKLVAPSKWFQGWTKEDESRARSSSGGFAYSIMLSFLKNRGIVCSCVFQKGNFIYKIATNETELNDFRGSKYVKSNPERVYKQIKELLRSGKEVLFIGLPCHVAGLKNYIGENDGVSLYTVDLICHGSPSQMLLSQFLEENGILIDNISNITFRQKNKFRLDPLKEGSYQERSLTPPGVRDRYTIGFLNGLFYTENCYQCKYARISRCSDLTIGDSWGSDLESTENGPKGISLALCQTKKGEDLIQNCNLELVDVDLERAISANHQLKEPSRMPEQREKFFSLLENEKTFKSAVTRCYPKTCIRQDIKSLLCKLRMINVGGGNGV